MTIAIAAHTSGRYPVLIASFRFPRNSAITELDAIAKTFATHEPFFPDAILFGKWKD